MSTTLHQKPLKGNRHRLSKDANFINKQFTKMKKTFTNTIVVVLTILGIATSCKNQQDPQPNLAADIVSQSKLEIANEATLYSKMKALGAVNADKTNVDTLKTTPEMGAKAMVASNVYYTASYPAVGAYTGVSTANMSLSCAPFQSGLKASIVSVSGNKVTVKIQKGLWGQWGVNGTAYVKAGSNACGDIQGSTTIYSYQYEALVDFWVNFTGDGNVVQFTPSVSLNNGLKYYAPPISIRSNIDYTIDNCTSLSNAECVAYARCRKNGNLQGNLFNFQQKVAIITTYVPQANAVAIIKVGSGTNGNGVGHVAYVEKVVGSTIYIAESNWSPGKITRRSGTASSLNIVGYYY